MVATGKSEMLQRAPLKSGASFYPVAHGFTFTRFVFQSCGWKKKLTYRVPGVRLAPDSHKVYFDLRQALEVHEGRTKPAY